jgi:uncharacterized protein (TIGR00730 family)
MPPWYRFTPQPAVAPGPPRHTPPYARSMSSSTDDPPRDDAPRDDATSGQPRPPLEAFADLAFLRSPDARLIRVAAELLEPRYRLEREGIEDTIVFFGSARIPSPETTQDSASHPDLHPGLANLTRYYADAQELARRLTEWSMQRPGDRQFVVCSGGGPGIMEAANRGASEAGGPSIGFGIAIPHEQSINEWVTPDLAFLFHYFFLRKFWFLYAAKALVYFPGGFGTLDELMEVLTLVQTKKVRKPMGIVLYGSEFWNNILNLDLMVEHGVISPEDRDLFVICDDVEDATEKICGFLEENYGPTLLLGE